MLNRENVQEFIGQIIDIFEDFLEERNINLRNDEREQSGADAAIIYGTDYGQLQEELSAMMHSWGVVE